MKEKILGAFAAIFCVVALLSNNMVIKAESEHVCVAERNPNSFKATSLTFIDCGNNHGRFGIYDKWCKTCYCYMGVEEGYGDYEAHKYLTYTDLGHGDMSHNYIIYCGPCGHSHRINIVCDYEVKGYHSTPF